jgi:hypothetical protein
MALMAYRCSGSSKRKERSEDGRIVGQVLNLQPEGSLLDVINLLLPSSSSWACRPNNMMMKMMKAEG